MAGKARVHELAKELGVTSKEVLARLGEQGEFVKSASSTVEAPVARRLRESFGGSKPAPAKTSGNDEDLFVEDLEFDETKTYVKRVMENYARYRQLYEKTDRPSLPK